MDHSCSKCGAVVDDGVPFCPQCRAPQIRVAVEVQPLPEGDLNRAAFPGPAEFPGQSGFHSLPNAQIQWGRALPMAAAGAGISLILFLLGLPFGVFAFLAGGAAAVMLYGRRVPGVSLTSGTGAKIGAVSGVIGFLSLGVIFLATITASSASRGEVQKLIQEQISGLTAKGYNPEQVKPVLDFLKTPEGFTYFIAFSMFFSALIFVGASALGGVLGARLMSRRNRR